MTAQNLHLALHYFWWTFFVAMGLFLIIRQPNFLGAQCADCHLTLAPGAAPDANARVESAVERRIAAEGGPLRLGVWMGSFCIVLGIISGAGWLQPALLYAFMCLGFAIAIAVGFLQLRNSQPTRVAVLSVRHTDEVIPTYFFYVAVFSALTPLCFASGTQLASAVIVTVSALITTVLAWRLTKLPALLSGVDVPAEQLVDDRLRFYRTRAALMYALIQPFVLASQYQKDATTVQTVAFFVTLVIFFAFAIWMVRRQFAKVRLA